MFQIDTPTLDKPKEANAADWNEFESRVHVDPNGLYFDDEIHD